MGSSKAYGSDTLSFGEGRGEADAKESLQLFLNKRTSDLSLRSLPDKSHLIDFCSNDYLGFSRSALLREKIKKELEQSGNYPTGSTGSRLITGNHPLFEELESFIVQYHHAEAGLIFNSGYDTNLGFFSSVPQKNDLVLFDELVHASIRDGIKLTRGKAVEFRHNDLEDLKQKLGHPLFPPQGGGRRAGKASLEGARPHDTVGRGLVGEEPYFDNIYIAVESVYSMDGDFAPLKELAEICRDTGANLVVDEAHATGLFGPKGEGRVVELDLEKEVFARIHTFSKALGCQGAIILGSETLKQFLINFARPFVFSTAMSFHSLIAVKFAYDILEKQQRRILKIKTLTGLLKQKLEYDSATHLIPSESPIQSIIIPGNENALRVSNTLEKAGFYAKAILYPTVPRGKERIRLVMHSFNTGEEVERLCSALEI